jgi:hypothetical protein
LALRSGLGVYDYTVTKRDGVFVRFSCAASIIILDYVFETYCFENMGINFTIINSKFHKSGIIFSIQFLLKKLSTKP